MRKYNVPTHKINRLANVQKIRDPAKLDVMPLSTAQPIRKAAGINPKRYPTVGPVKTIKPLLNPEKTGRPRAPSNR
tara:strand:+ start:922 stop:1149 length:228 start_codon:yes stop_codon:yes gene_type:complete